MCGIAGIIGEKISKRDIRVVEAMKEILKHRGPDDEGTVSGETFVFGHRRLSIIDLKTGHQPMQTEDGRWTIVYNGEIYNYIELKQDLIAKGVVFKTLSDTEVLLKLIQTQGIEAVGQLNGMFAFSVYDNQEKILYAACDAFGVKPFYYTFTPAGSFLFASEIKALLAHPDIVAETNRAALQEYLTFQFCLKNKTLFKNIYKLEPGTYLVLRHNELQPHLTKYWNLDYRIDSHHTEEYFTDSILKKLREATRLQLRSDVEVGAYLSGGIDSSAVVGLAARQYERRLQCFHGKFDEAQDYDESSYARQMADSVNGQLHMVTPHAQDFIELLPKLIYHMDEPAAGPGLFPQYMVSKLASQKVKVVLAGTGGDEIFGGYARYLIAYLEQCLKGAIFETQEEGKHIVTLDSMIPNLSLLKQYVPLLKNFWQDGLFETMDKRYYRLINRSHDLNAFLSPGVLAEWDEECMFHEFKDIFHNPNTLSYVNKMTHFDQKTLLPALLQVEDRVSMACSLESRVPLLDKTLVDMITKMPPAMKFHGGKTKYILKNALNDVLPAVILNRKDKMGFPIPLKEWYESEAKSFVCDTLFSQKAKQRGLFDTKALEGILDQEARFSRQIWGALCLELWFEQFHVSL